MSNLTLGLIESALSGSSSGAADVQASIPPWVGLSNRHAKRATKCRCGGWWGSLFSPRPKTEFWRKRAKNNEESNKGFRFPMVGHRMAVSISPQAVCLGALLILVASLPTTTFAQTPANPKKIKKEPCSARIHLQQGSRQGYLVVRVQLKPGESIYDVKAKATNSAAKKSAASDAPTTSIKLTKSPQWLTVGAFSPDKPAKKVRDPYLGNIKKHTGTVQFFAPIKLAENIDLKRLKLKVEMSGLVCDQQTCAPLDKSLTAKFAGYFQAKKRSANASSVPAPAKGQLTPKLPR